MATPSEILIPVRRRHEDTRSQIENAVTQKQQWGYAEDEDLLFIRRKNKTRRYFSRNQLFRPNSAYQPSIIVESDSLQINHNAYNDGSWRRYSADYSWMESFSERNWYVYFGNTGAAGGLLGTRSIVLHVSDIFFWVNQARADSDFIVSSVNNQNSIYMQGDTGYISLNGFLDNRWGANPVNSLIEFDDSSDTDPSIFVNSSVFYRTVNAYAENTGSSGFKRKTASSATRFRQTASDYAFDYGASDLVDSVITWLNLLSLGSVETVFNEDQLDIDFRIETNNYASTLFVWGEKDNVGIHTSTPLDNVGTANGDFAQYGYGLHVKAPSGFGSILVIEGGVNPESGLVSSALILCDNNAAVDEKTLMLECTNERAYFSSIDDDVSASLSYNVFSIISMQLSNGYVGIGKSPSDRGILSISLSTDDLTIIDADDSINSVGAQTAVIEVDVGTDQNKYIAVYDQPT